MEKTSPKIEIINHFDKLIQQVDIEIEECLETYKEDQLLGQVEFEDENRTIQNDCRFKLAYHDCFRAPKTAIKQEIWKKPTKQTKVIDYLSQIRTESIERLRKLQEWSLEYYTINKSDFNSFKQFYFQLKVTRVEYKKFVYNLYSFATDFYLSQFEIDLLE